MGKSQKIFSEELHITQSYLSSIERGEKNITEKIIISILDVFKNLNLNWLFTGQEKMLVKPLQTDLENEYLKVLKENAELKGKLIALLEQPVKV